ncbi:hypothetical protein [Streptomyces sp. AA1529]|uniref:hypothetical protein n=1 Tax=Streptomyces sp. AA1529 TaxID=1203257 RepID=UPI003D754481
MQTYAQRTEEGEWHLFDDMRQGAPTWKEKCGRSNMSNQVNRDSMGLTFRNQFSGAGKQRLLDKEEYWVVFPEVGNCKGPKCTIK